MSDNENKFEKKPLAYRMTPASLDEFVGQEDIVGKGSLLRRMIEADRMRPVILYGPPGTGKTSLARIIASTTKANFEKINAVTSGVADIKRIISETRSSLMNPASRTVLFIDEIHRFNKSQQDALLPSVEDGTIVLIGATTENPFFEVNKALISRSSVFMLKPLTAENIKVILNNALVDRDRGYGEIRIRIEEDALNFLSEFSSGDARIALNALELAVMTTELDSSGCIPLTIETLQECLQRKALKFDKKGEEHYDNISAMIKSMRGSSPDGAIFYLARALYAGEDINFLARRIVICAAEDVGLANPTALIVAQSAAEAVRMIGMPEARIILSEACSYVAVSPKSNAAYTAINEALEDISKIDTGSVPMWLRNAPAKGMKDLGYSIGYKYAHNYEGNYVDMQFLPDKIKDRKYYNPTDNGHEKKIKEWMEGRKKS
ncbi:MAG: replication-associated recombination protein A [Clostridia bacterium]|nr:replication-associated recombination protein A [Clostridia bacterium]MBN2884149.1 replication-associated recombination protein A [Clostridia bacterium]